MDEFDARAGKVGDSMDRFFADLDRKVRELDSSREVSRFFSSLCLYGLGLTGLLAVLSVFWTGAQFALLFAFIIEIFLAIILLVVKMDERAASASLDAAIEEERREAGIGTSTKGGDNEGEHCSQAPHVPELQGHAGKQGNGLQLPPLRERLLQHVREGRQILQARGCHLPLVRLPCED